MWQDAQGKSRLKWLAPSFFLYFHQSCELRGTALPTLHHEWLGMVLWRKSVRGCIARMCCADGPAERKHVVGVLKASQEQVSEWLWVLIDLAANAALGSTDNWDEQHHP